MSRKRIKRKAPKHSRPERWRCPQCQKDTVELRYLKPDKDGKLPEHSIVFTCQECKRSWKGENPETVEVLLGPKAAAAARRVKEIQGR